MIWRDRREGSRRMKRPLWRVSDRAPALDAEVEQLWVAEAQRRYEAFLKGELEALPGYEVMARVRSRLQ